MRRQRNLLGPQGMGGMVSLWGASGIVESVQQGTVTMSSASSGTATITAVDMSRSLLFSQLISTAYSSAVPAISLSRLDFTNATTITATRTSAASSVYASFVVVQFMPGVIKQIQRATVTINNGVASVDTTLVETNLNKSIATSTFLANNTTADSNVFTRSLLTTSTNLRSTRETTADINGVAYQVAEFF